MKTLLLLVVLSDCATVYRPADPGPRATANARAFRRADMETRWIVTVNNPMTEDVYLDCDEVRIRIPARVQTDILLMPDDQDCDLKNEMEYASMPGRRVRTRAPRLCNGP